MNCRATSLIWSPLVRTLVLCSTGFLKNPSKETNGGWLYIWSQHQPVKRTLNEYFRSVVISLPERETRPKKFGEEIFLEN